MWECLKKRIIKKEAKRTEEKDVVVCLRLSEAEIIWNLLGAACEKAEVIFCRKRYTERSDKRGIMSL